MASWTIRCADENCSWPPFPAFPLLVTPPPPARASQSFNPLLIIVFAVAGGTFLLVTYYAVILKYFSCLKRSRIVPPQPESGQEDFLDEDHGPVIDHPIWFIRTVGLPENIINSINVCKYQKGEGLIEETECSVCLGEFQEDESLRLLPKCSHAFHVSCIDTWLRAHTNCPLCRAPIVSNPDGSAVTEMNSSNLDTIDETQSESSGGDGASGSNQGGGEVEAGSEHEVVLRIDDGTSDAEVEKEATAILSSTATSGLQVPGRDSGVDRQEEGSIQPVRRSFSMGSLAAAMNCFSLANITPSESGGSSSTQVVPVKESNSELVVKNRGESTSIFKVMGSSLARQALKAGPLAMERSASSGAMFFLSTYAGTKRNSILPQ